MKMSASIVSVVYLDGAKEEGKNVTRAGMAVVKLDNGDVFKGEYKQVDESVVKHGHGVYTWKNGSKYDGLYANGKRSGKGTYAYANGAKYTGEWKDGSRNGNGTETYPNGDSFTGLWADDRKNGPGVYAYKNGAKLTGMWEDDQFVDGSWELGTQRMSFNTIASKLKKRISQPRKSAVRKGKPLGIIISGAPASGKGTQCEFIREEFGVIHLSTGDMLRAAVAAGTELGKKAKTLMESGKLVPDDVVIGAVKERLEQDDVRQNGFLLDGFPRTAAQAEALDRLGQRADVFLMLNVPDEALVARVVGRRIDPETGNSYHVDFNPPPKDIEDRVIQRADDTEEKVKVRLQGFHENVEAIKDFYKKVTVEVDGTRPKDDIRADISKLLHTRRSAM